MRISGNLLYRGTSILRTAKGFYHNKLAINVLTCMAVFVKQTTGEGVNAVSDDTADRPFHARCAQASRRQQAI